MELFEALERGQWHEFLPQAAELTAVLSLILVTVLAMLVFSVYLNSAVRKKGRRAFADLQVQERILEDGVILCKNGALMSSWSYQGPDQAAQQNIERNDQVRLLNDLFRSFDSSCMVSVDAIRRPVPQYPSRSSSAFPDPVSYAVDEERRRDFLAAGRMFETIFVLTFTWFPPKKAQEKIKDFLYDTPDDQKKDTPDKVLSGILETFRGLCGRIDGCLQLCMGSRERLKSAVRQEADGTSRLVDLQLSYYYYCNTGRSLLMYLPDPAVRCDMLIAGGDLFPGVTPLVGDQYIRTVSIDSLPGEVSPGILTALGELNCEYRWSSRFIFLNREEAQARFAKERRSWEQKQRGFFQQLFNLGGRINAFAVEMAGQAEQARTELEAAAVGYGYYTPVIVLMDTDLKRLNENTRRLILELSRIGLSGREETIGCLDAFLGSLPGHGTENLYRPLISTADFSCLIPLSTPWIGRAECPNPMYPEGSPALMYCVTGTALNTVFRFNLHSGDLGHTLVLGPTGSGKSTLLCTLAVQSLRYRGMSVFAFDKGLSMYTLCRAVGGQHYNPASEGSELCFCPLQYLDDSSDLAWAADWIETLLKLNSVQITPQISNEITATLQGMAARHRENPDTGMTLTHFCSEVQNAEVRQALAAYTVSGTLGNLLDADHDGLSGFSRFNVFEIETLWNLSEKFRLPVILYLFRRIEKSLHGQPALIFLDEAWVVLGHPVFSEKVREWLKVLRKANCAVILATQSLDDLTGSPLLGTLVESTPTKILLPNPEARLERFRPLYENTLGLNYVQIGMIADGVRKRDYFVTGENGHSRMIRLMLGPVALAFTAVSSKEDIALVNRLIEEYGEGEWVRQWLKHRGADPAVLDAFTESNLEREELNGQKGQ